LSDEVAVSTEESKDPYGGRNLDVVSGKAANFLMTFRFVQALSMLVGAARKRNRWRIAAILILILCNCTALLCQTPSAVDEMRAGVVAYKFSDYSGAVEHFKAALEINPDLTQARLFLATAYAQQYIAGDDSAANAAMAEQAIDEFKKVLSSDPTETEEYKSVVPIASLSFNLKRLDEAREYYGKAIELNPTEARNYFMIGLIDWTEASNSRMKARSELGLTESQMISKPEACVSLRAQNQQKVEDGMQRMQKALALQPDYDDAMGYMNLLYRERAEYECDDPEARKADLKAADDWTDKAIATKAKAEKAAAEKPAAKQP
jgi:tetratricopeptide (TPR) repeat protein